MKAIICIVFMACALPATGWCALGEKMAAPQAAPAGAHKLATSPALFTTQETQNAAGTTVREYAGADGIVFALTWRGPTLPDLRHLLGAHFARAAAMPRLAGGGHAHWVARDDALVVESHGHMRAFSGRAYLPKLLPAGVSMEQID